MMYNALVYKEEENREMRIGWLDQYFIIIFNHIEEVQSTALELWFADIFLEWFYCYSCSIVV